jgi:subtilisin family serine protease
MIPQALKKARVLTVATMPINTMPINTMDPLQRVMLAPLMALTAGSAQVVIGLIDGPVAKDHPGFAGASVLEFAATPSEVCSLVSSAACRHGTAVAGMLCASRQFLLSAICPGCTLLVRQIFSASGNETGGVPNAEPEALAGAISDCIGAGASVLNLSVSLGDASRSAADTLSEALNYAARRDVLVVAAAGNDGTIYSSAITRHPWVIPVTACGRADVPLGTSNLSSSVGRRGLLAPGERITSLGPNGQLMSLSGTSFAVPFVTGSIALLWTVFPDASAAEVRVAIVPQTSHRAAIVPPMLNATAAYQRLAAIRRRITA